MLPACPHELARPLFPFGSQRVRQTAILATRRAQATSECTVEAA